MGFRGASLLTRPAGRLPRVRDPRHEPPRIALPLVLLVVAMVGGGLYTGVTALLDDGDDGDGSTAAATTSTTAEPLPPLERVRSTAVAGGDDTEPAVLDAAPPASYRIRSLVRRPGEDDAVEELHVERPFTSRRVTTAPGGEVTELETAFGRIATRTPPGEAQVIATNPTPPDDRPDAILSDATAAGLLVAREERVVAGERCRVLRSGRASDVLEKPTDEDHTDTCVSADGLVLERWTVEGGQAVEQRIATEVERSPSAPIGPQLPIVPTLDVNTGGGFVRRADPASEPPGEFLVLDTPPEGFTFDGRFTVIPAQTALSDPEQRDTVVAGTTDVYRRGPDVVLVDRGATRGTVRAFEPHPGARAVDLGSILGEGEALSTWRGNEVRVTRPGGRFVRVSGTVPTAELQRVAAALRTTPGGDGLRYLE